LHESIEGLNIRPDGTYIDATYGGGGHSKEILKHLITGKLVAFDMDGDAEKNKTDDEHLLFVRHNFRYMKNFLKYYNISQADGILADLGVSSHQFDQAERGFSFRSEAALDMRMNNKSHKNAATIINTYSEEKLNNIFFQYGELSNARKLAATVVKSRQQNQLKTINQFVESIKSCIPTYSDNKYLAQVFQSIRIEVNNELGNLKELLKQSVQVLAEKGRLVVITYHSLEDRLVKNFMKTGNFEGKPDKDFYGNVSSPFRLVNKNVIVPSEDEIKSNNRARSAKLRIAERVG
jgi:16S rRNA (cytosine1402-N4)-methyltransferase